VEFCTMDRRQCVTGMAAVAATAAIPALPTSAAADVAIVPAGEFADALARAAGDAPLPLRSLDDARDIVLRCYLQAFGVTVRHTDDGLTLVRTLVRRVDAHD
jgi:hypothetical protein